MKSQYVSKKLDVYKGDIFLLLSLVVAILFLNSCGFAEVSSQHIDKEGERITPNEKSIYIGLKQIDVLSGHSNEYPISGKCGVYVEQVRLTTKDQSETLGIYPCINGSFSGLVQFPNFNTVDVDIVVDALLSPEGSALDREDLDIKAITLNVDTIEPHFAAAFTSFYRDDLTLVPTSTNTPVTNISPLTYQLEFDEPIQGLSIDDFVISNAILTTITSTSNTHSISLIPFTSGPINIQFKEDSVTDKSNNSNPQGTDSTIYYDIDGPSTPSAINLGLTPFGVSSTPTISFTSGIDQISGFKNDEIQLWKDESPLEDPQGDSLVLDWQEFNSGSALTSLNLELGGYYYIKIRSVDQLRNVGQVVSSSTWRAGPLAEPLATINGAPSNLSAQTALDITIGGSNISAYKYKVIEGTSATCSDETGYSSTQVDVAVKITDDIVGLASGNITVCTIGMDNLGFWQSVANATSVTWTKISYDLNVTAVLSKLPGPVDTNTWINGVTVSGSDITHFRTKIGEETSTDCSTLDGYGAENTVASTITVYTGSISTGSRVKICVIGSKGGNNANYQDPSSATQYSWLKESTATVDMTYLGQSYQDGDTPVNFQVRLSSTKPYNTTVKYRIFGDTIAGSDHDLYTSQVTIPAGQTTATVNYNLIRNIQINPEKAFNIQLIETSSPAIAIGSSGLQVNSIKDADSGAYSDVIQSSTGTYHSCGLTSTGVLKCWGYNSDGQLGDGSLETQLRAIHIDSGTTYIQVSAGGYHTCAITTSNDLKCWGDNAYGQLGVGHTTDVPTPTLVDSGTKYLSVSAGVYQTCGITNLNELKCWGYNNSGRLGDGTTTQRLSPTLIDSGTTYRQISTFSSHSCAITMTGSLKCWGLGNFGQLGTGLTTGYTVPTPTDTGTIYKQISTGGTHTCGITDTDVLKCWGYNSSGQLGDGTTSLRLSPVIINAGTTYSQIASGSSSTCGITTSNVLKCWGRTPTIIDPGTEYSYISQSTQHKCGITTSGDLKCWGYNSYGQLGDGYVANSTQPPTQIASDETFTQVSTQYQHACGITSSGVLKCWGSNSSYQLGYLLSSIATLPNPTTIDGGSTYSQVSAGNSYTCGITTLGYLKCWGTNTYGNIGDGTTVTKYSPTPIEWGIKYSKVSAYNITTCAITISGDLKCWGRNYNRQVGDGTNVDRYSPVLIDGGTTYSDISTGYYHTCGITTSGELKCWGLNDKGQLGDGTTLTKGTPTPIDVGTTYVKVYAGFSSTCGITSAGVAKCWGDNTGGQLGDGTTTNRLTPTPIDSSNTYTDITKNCALNASGTIDCWGGGQLSPTPLADPGTQYLKYSGSSNRCGITSTGVVKCWGLNAYGQLGTDTIPSYMPHLILGLREPGP